MQVKYENSIVNIMIVILLIILKKTEPGLESSLLVPINLTAPLAQSPPTNACLVVSLNWDVRQMWAQKTLNTLPN